MKLKIHLAAALAALLSSAFSGSAAAGDWAPTRPMKIIVPFNPGAAADTTARLLAEKLAAGLGQPVVVENRGGAGGIIGTAAGAASAPDGHTLMIGTDANLAIAPQLQSVPFNPIKDFQPVSLVVSLPLVLVVNPQKTPVQDAKDLIARAKADPGKLVFATSGNGSSHHMAMELFQKQAGVRFLHVPYKGAAQALTDLLAGEAHAMFNSLGPVLPHIRSGKLKVLAVSDAQRMQQLPYVPTVAEAGVPGYEFGLWQGLLYPAQVPKDAVTRVSAEIAKILAMPDVAARFAELGYTVVGSTPEAMSKRMISNYSQYGKIIREANIKAD
ncbi:tripartite tricarboxylate transporter substrate binding protein [Variovorax paradoxus]|nr:tripartite tricarboxylate transporter substrate binding protein [Variovorax paradoxus]MBT2305450.1 tripartite tricarboxylate transporter substrate binding protein [Variovorax paradoxus]